MTRTATLAIAAWLILGAVTPAGAGVVDLLDRVIALENDNVTIKADVRVLQSDAAPVPGRLDELDRLVAGNSERIERDHDEVTDLTARVTSNSSRDDVQASRLNGIEARLSLLDQRLDAIPTEARCILPPLAYRHVSVRTAKGKKVTALVPTKTPIGFKKGVYWLARINADCVKRLP